MNARSRLVFAVVAGLVLSTLTALPASAASCSLHTATKTLTVSMFGGQDATIEREDGGTAILLDGASCDGALVTNTDKISVKASNGFDTLTISLAGGAFAPGATLESTGRSEIEFTVDPGSGTGDVFVLGSPRRDHVMFFGRKINLNNKEKPKDADVALEPGANSVGTDGSFGRDTIWLIGGKGTNGGSWEGGAGNDRFVANHNGGASFTGGSEKDTVDYFYGPGAITYDAGTVETIGGIDILTDVEHVIGTPFADLFIGGPSGETLEGRGGADTIRPGDGDDRIRGGAGVGDLLEYPGAAAMKINLAVGIATGLGRDTFAAVERFTGGSGNDTFIDAPGTDRLNGREGFDTVSYKKATRAVYARMSPAPGVKGADVLKQIEKIVGSRYGDTLIGDTKNNVLVGLGGPDMLSALGGDDMLSAGSGDDRLNGGTGIDTCNPGTGANVVRRCEA